MSDKASWEDVSDDVLECLDSIEEEINSAHKEYHTISANEAGYSEKGSVYILAMCMRFIMREAIDITRLLLKTGEISQKSLDNL